MPQPFRAVIFDLDGVLADSEPWWNQIDAQLLAEYGVTYRGEHHRDVLGVSYAVAVEFYKNAFNLSAPKDEDALSGIAAAKAANMRVAAIPDRRFVDPSDYENEADYMLVSLTELPLLLRKH